jgi:tetratricopeptide (TPR) repeat protein
VEILAGAEERKLLDKTWEIKPPVSYGEPLLLEYRYNENQVLELNMYLIRDGKKVEQFNVIEENPLTNVVNPEGKQLLIDEMESELTSGKIERTTQPEKLLEIAELQADLGQYEKALDRLKNALKIKGKPDANILNKMAVYYGEMGDHESEEKMYRNAAIDAKWPGAWFNLALAQKRRGKHAEALASVDNAIAKEPAAPYIVLRAMILEKLGEKEQSKKELEDALALFDPVGSLSDWELGWLSTAARMAGDSEKQKEADQEIKGRARRAVSNQSADEERLYPLQKRTSIRRMS